MLQGDEQGISEFAPTLASWQLHLPVVAILLGKSEGENEL